MSEIQRSLSVRQLVKAHPGILSFRNRIVKCKPCNATWTVYSTDTILQHLDDPTHVQLLTEMHQHQARLTEQILISNLIELYPNDLKRSSAGELCCSVCNINIGQVDEQSVETHLNDQLHITKKQNCQIEHYKMLNRLVCEAFQSNVYTQFDEATVGCLSCGMRIGPSLGELQAHIVGDNHRCSISNCDSMQDYVSNRSLVKLVCEHEFLKFDTFGRVVCLCCSVYLTRDNYVVKRHLNETSSHAKSVELHFQYGSNYVDSVEFKKLIAELFLVNDIATWKLTGMTPLLERLLARTIPSETSLRLDYVPLVYLDYRNEVRNAIGDNYLSLFIDETTDRDKRPVVAILLGTLFQFEPNKQQVFLWDIKTKPKSEVCETETENVDEQPYACKRCKAKGKGISGDLLFDMVIESLGDLYGGTNKIQFDKLLILMTDRGSNMLRLGRLLQDWFPNVRPIPCLCHALHNLCETIESFFPDVTSYVSSIGMVFAHSAANKELFHEATGETIPMRFVMTRWGTWLLVVLYHYAKGGLVGDFLPLLDQTRSVANATNLHSDPDVRDHIEYITLRYSCVIDFITKFEKRHKYLGDVVDSCIQLNKLIYRWVFDEDGEIDAIAHAIYLRYQEVIFGNNGFWDLIDDIEADIGKPDSLTNYLHYAPIDNSEAERALSLYCNIYTSRRFMMEVENVGLRAFIEFKAIALVKKATRPPSKSSNEPRGLYPKVEILFQPDENGFFRRVTVPDFDPNKKIR